MAHSACTAECVATIGPSSRPARSQKPASFEMTDVDHDPQLGAAAHEREPGLRQTGPGVRGGGRDERDAVTERVGPAPNGAQRAEPRRIPQLERLQSRIDRLRPLEVEHRHRRPVPAERGVQIVHAASETNRTGALEREQAPGDRAGPRRRDLVLHRPLPVVLGLDEHREDAAPQPPARIRGRSRCPPGRPPTSSAWSSAISASLCPSKTAGTAYSATGNGRSTAGSPSMLTAFFSRW